MENSVTETISRMEGCPSLWALEVFQQQFPIEFSFLDHCVLSLFSNALSNPFLSKTLLAQKQCCYVYILLGYIGFSHSLALREQKPRADFFFPNWPWEILYKRLLFEDCSLSSSFSPWESPRSLKYFWYFLFSDGEIGQADCNMTIKVRE